MDPVPVQYHGPGDPAVQLCGRTAHPFDRYKEYNHSQRSDDAVDLLAVLLRLPLSLSGAGKPARRILLPGVRRVYDGDFDAEVPALLFGVCRQDKFCDGSEHVDLDGSVGVDNEPWQSAHVS